MFKNALHTQVLTLIALLFIKTISWNIQEMFVNLVQILLTFIPLRSLWSDPGPYVFWNGNYNMIKLMRWCNYLYIYMYWTNTVKIPCFIMPCLKYQNVSIIHHSWFPVYPFYPLYQPHTLNKSALSWLRQDSKSEATGKRDEVPVKTGLFVIFFQTLTFWMTNILI